MSRRMSYRTVEVEVDLSQFDNGELIEELESRGLDLNSSFIDGDEMRGLLQAVYQKRRLGEEYDQVLDQLIYYGLGRVI